MAEIVVGGLKFKIKGDEPNAEEQLAIDTLIQSRNQRDEDLGVDVLDQDQFFITPEDVLTEAQKGKYNKDTESFLSSPDFKRIVLEVGLSIAGGIAGAAAAPFSGGSSLALTATSAARIARIARPLLNISSNTVGKIGRATLGAAAGGGTGAALAQTFDPKEDIVKEVARGALTGGFGEILGFGMAGALSKGYNKLTGAKITQLRSAKAAANVLERQKAYYLALEKIREKGSLAADDLLRLEKELNLPKAQLDLLRNPNAAVQRLTELETKYGSEFLGRIKKGQLTPAMITDNAIIDQLQAIGESSLFGSGPLRSASQGARLGLVAGIDEFTSNVIKNVDAGNLDPRAIGTLIQENLSQSQKIYNDIVAEGYAKLNPQVAAATEMRIAGETLPLPKEGFGINLNYQGTKKILDPGTGKIVDKDSILSYADREYKRLINTPGSSKEAIDMLDDARKLRPTETFNRLADTTTNFSRKVPLDMTAKQVKGELLNRAYHELNTANLPPVLATQRNKLSQLVKLGSANFNKKVFGKIIATEMGQEQIYKSIIVGNKKSVADRFFSKIDETTPDGQRLIPLEQADKIKNGVRGYFFKDFLRAATKTKDQYTYLDAAAARQFVKRDYADFIKDGKFVTKTQAKTLEDFTNALTYAEGSIYAPGSIGKGRGTVFIQLKEAGAVTQLFGGLAGATGAIDPGTAGVFILGPYALSKMFTSPKLMDLVLNGVRAKPRNFNQFSRLINQIGAGMVSQGIITEEENNIAQRTILDNKQMFEDAYKGDIAKYATLPEEENPAAAPAINIQLEGERPVQPSPTLPQVAPANIGNIGSIPQQQRVALASGDLLGAIAARPQLRKGGIVNAKKTNT